jgi:Uma2 family endonuclease
VTDPDGFVSPSQTTTQLALKAQFCRTNGVDEVWLIDHRTRTVEVWTAEGRTTLDDAATLTSPLLPRFAVAVTCVLDG